MFMYRSPCLFSVEILYERRIFQMRGGQWCEHMQTPKRRRPPGHIGLQPSLWPTTRCRCMRELRRRGAAVHPWRGAREQRQAEAAQARLEGTEDALAAAPLTMGAILPRQWRRWRPPRQAAALLEAAPDWAGVVASVDKVSQHA